jgi:hypothetical protein
VALRAARPFSPVSSCMESIYDTAARRLRISPVHLDIRHMNRAELLQVGCFHVFLGLRSSDKASAWRIPMLSTSRQVEKAALLTNGLAVPGNFSAMC